MSKRAWLTPDELPGARQCWRVFVPDCEMMEAAFRGALHLLAIEYNWELHGAQTPETIAALWLDANYQTFGMTACQPGGGEMHIGQVFYFASGTPPDGALVCDGSLHNAVDYPALYALIGTQWGGTGVTFGVPDLRGDFIRAVSGSVALGSTGGEEAHTLTVGELPEHQHGFMTSVGGSALLRGTPDGLGIGNTAQTQASGGDEAHNNIPPYMALVAMIQAE